MVRVHCGHGTPWFRAMMAYRLLMNTLQVAGQCLLTFQQDSTDVTRNRWSFVQAFNVLLHAVVVLEDLSTVGTFILLPSFCQQDWAFWMAVLKVVDKVLGVVGHPLPAKL